MKIKYKNCGIARLAETSPARRGGANGRAPKFFVYVLKSIIAKKSYVGFTNNMGRRLKEHNLGGHYYTKRFAPWEIIYTERFNNFQDAINREKYLKSTSGRRFLKKVFKNC